jgi:hypothetical protein
MAIPAARFKGAGRLGMRQVALSCRGFLAIVSIAKAKNRKTDERAETP